MQLTVKHEVEMVVTEVHEYSTIPLFQMGGAPGGMHPMLASSDDQSKTPLLCIHMQKAEKSPVEPDIPAEGRMMIKSLQQAGLPMPSKMLQVIAQANIVISPEEYDSMGRPRAHEKVHVTFEYERV